MPIKVENEKFLYMNLHEIIEHIEKLENSLKITREMLDEEIRNHIKYKVKFETMRKKYSGFNETRKGVDVDGR